MQARISERVNVPLVSVHPVWSGSTTAHRGCKSHFCSNQFGIVGLPKTWLMPHWSHFIDFLSCFLTFSCFEECSRNVLTTKLLLTFYFLSKCILDDLNSCALLHLRVKKEIREHFVWSSLLQTDYEGWHWARACVGRRVSMQHVDLMLRNVLVYLPAPGRCWPAMHSQSSW